MLCSAAHRPKASAAASRDSGLDRRQSPPAGGAYLLSRAAGPRHRSRLRQPRGRPAWWSSICPSTPVKRCSTGRCTYAGPGWSSCWPAGRRVCRCARRPPTGAQANGGARSQLYGRWAGSWRIHWRRRPRRLTTSPGRLARRIHRHPRGICGGMDALRALVGDRPGTARRG